jgi:hypothetical protein
VGTSRSGAELAGKLNRLAKDMADTRRPLNAAALAAKMAFIAAAPGVVGHRVARGRVNVRYDIKGQGQTASAVVRYTGPAHLALNPTKPHRIEPRFRRRRGRRAITIGSDVRAWANHPGTRGKDPGARKAKAAAAKVAPRAYAKTGLTEPLRRIF